MAHLPTAMTDAVKDLDGDTISDLRALAFETVFNSLEPLSADQVRIVMNRSHQRITAPAIDNAVIEQTWAQMLGCTQPSLSPADTCMPLTAKALELHTRRQQVVTDESDSGLCGADRSLTGSTAEQDSAVERWPVNLTVTPSSKSHMHTAVNGQLPLVEVFCSQDQQEGSVVSRKSDVYRRAKETHRDECTLSASGCGDRSQKSGRDGDRVSATARRRTKCMDHLAEVPGVPSAATVPPARPVLFNGLKFRLHDVDIAESGAALLNPLLVRIPSQSSQRALSTHSRVSATTNGRGPLYRSGNTPARSPQSHHQREDSRHFCDVEELISRAPLPLPPFQSFPLDEKDASLLGNMVCASPSTSLHATQETAPGETEEVFVVTKPKCVLECTLRLGITDYKTAVATTKHAKVYERYVATRDKDVGVLFGDNAPSSARASLGVLASSADTSTSADRPGRQLLRPQVVPPTSQLSLCLRSEELGSRADFMTHRAERYLSGALGVEAIVVTADRYAVLFRRSNRVVEYPGWYCCPGGHPEPKHIMNVKNLPDKQEGPAFLSQVCEWFMCVSNEVLVREFFGSILMEVSDELGIPQSTCVNEGLLSVVRNRKTRKPDMCFLVNVRLSRREVETIFNRRAGKDAFESERGSLMFMSLQHYSTPKAVLQFVDNELQGCITPPSLACLVHGILCIASRK